MQRNERKLAAICAFALCAPLGVAAFVGHINATPFIAATPPVKPPVPNGYDLYVAASNSIKPANPPVDANLATKFIKDPKLRAQRYSLARKDAWLAQNQAGFALFARAQQVQSWAPPIYSMNGSKALRQMARYKVIESNAHWQRGDHNRALQSGLDILQLGHDVQRGGDDYDFIVGTGIQSLARRAMSDTLEHLTAKQARAAARRAQTLIAGRWTLDRALIEDKARVSRDWLDYFDTATWRADWVRQLNATNKAWGFAPLTWKERGLIHIISKRRIMADLDIVYARAIFNARLPYAIKGKPQTPLDNPFVDVTYNYLAHYRFGAARELAGNQLLMLRLALRAYQLEYNGAPPRDLRALVPNYIAAVPLDPFGKGAPLRYKTDGKTYKLWSIGPDGRDDGGKPIAWRKKAPVRYADERPKLPFIADDSRGDIVAGKNH